MTELYPSSLSGIARARLESLDRIAKAARAAGRDSTDIALVAVSKKQPEERIEAMLSTGQRIFGENRVQEAQTRWTERLDAYPDLQLRLIGPLQSNKVVPACRLFDVIETLDRDRLAAALRQAMDKTGRSPQLYVQVNTGEEPQKAGVAPAEVRAFVNRCRLAYGLEIEGLMCIPPVEEPAAAHFALLAKLARACGLSQLSMGMSGDFELGVRLGASSVRIGAAVFGERPGPLA